MHWLTNGATDNIVNNTLNTLRSLKIIILTVLIYFFNDNLNIKCKFLQYYLD